MNTITQENYVDNAEQVIKTLKDRKNSRTGKEIPMVTTTKIRNLLAMTADIYNEILNHPEEELSDHIKDRIAYLRVRFVYEAGKDKDGKVRDFIETAKILTILGEIRGKRSAFLLFHRYIEALVAFHRFYGGRDD